VLLIYLSLAAEILEREFTGNHTHFVTVSITMSCRVSGWYSRGWGEGTLGQLEFSNGLDLGELEVCHGE